MADARYSQRKLAELGGRILDAFEDLPGLINELTLTTAVDKVRKWPVLF